MERIRLQKYLAQAGVASRREAEKLILAGKVSVNGQVIRELGSKVLSGLDQVTVKGETVSVEEAKLYLFHKPPGYITTLSDPQGRANISTFLKKLPVRAFPVGRLDRDVTGLLILTNDGDYAERLQHPRFGVPRTYLALVKGEVGPEALRKAVRGVKLEDGMGKAQSMRVLELTPPRQALVGNLSPNTTLVEVVVVEGRKHFVKNLLKVIGHPVIKLCRTAFGPYRLGDLAVGKIVERPFKELTFVPNGVKNTKKN